MLSETAVGEKPLKGWIWQDYNSYKHKKWSSTFYQRQNEQRNTSLSSLWVYVVVPASYYDYYLRNFFFLWISTSDWTFLNWTLLRFRVVCLSVCRSEMTWIRLRFTNKLLHRHVIRQEWQHYYRKREVSSQSGLTSVQFISCIVKIQPKLNLDTKFHYFLFMVQTFWRVA